MTPLWIHRLAHRAHRAGVPVLPRLLYAVNRLVYSVALPPSVQLGRDVVLGYSGLGTVIHARAVIGDRVTIGTCVTVGGRSGHHAVPVIESDVEIGSGAKVLGPIRVGAGAVIGANAVVLHNVPRGAVMVGVPARVVRIQDGWGPAPAPSTPPPPRDE
ncbi:serine O-acetyltransferase [Ideonella sp. A 288]|uniref:serine O-acetyltransferase n=1 Tax=Ideonella sp. A 288 TaxID=1962181 RepID=UPI000B4BE8BD|nr:serine acetyltransferase [Ideonella sp. A 288]